MKITPKEKKILHEDGSYGEWFVIEDDIVLYMDSHGCNVTLCVIENQTDDKLYGFTYEVSSEETFYDGDDEIVKVEKIQTTTYRPITHD